MIIGQPTNLKYLIRSELGLITILSAINRMSILAHHVAHIVSLCTKKQMAWVDAFTIITMVKNLETILNWTIDKYPHHTMGLNGFSVVPEVSSPVLLDTALPIPTFIRTRFTNKRPKSFFDTGSVVHGFPIKRCRPSANAVLLPQTTAPGATCYINKKTAIGCLWQKGLYHACSRM